MKTLKKNLLFTSYIVLPLSTILAPQSTRKVKVNSDSTEKVKV